MKWVLIEKNDQSLFLPEVETNECDEGQDPDDEDLGPVAAEDYVVLVRHQLGLAEVVAEMVKETIALLYVQ